MPVPFLIGFLIVARIFWQAMKDPVIRQLSLIVLAVLGVGMVLFHEVEGWGWLDALYFSVITLATVGFGDFTPETTTGKWLTMFYIFFGLGFLMAFLTTAVQRSRLWGLVESAEADADDAPGESRLPSWARH